MHEIPPPATATYDGSYDGLDGRGLCIWQAARRRVESDPQHVARRREIGHGRAAAHVGTLRRAKPFGQWQMWVALAVWPLIAWGAGSTLRVVDPGIIRRCSFTSASSSSWFPERCGAWCSCRCTSHCYAVAFARRRLFTLRLRPARHAGSLSGVRHGVGAVLKPPRGKGEITTPLNTTL